MNMKWSLKLFRFSGIEVSVHITFLLLIAWFAYIYWVNTGSISAVFSGIGFILTLFICVVLHEFGHALTAKRYGIQTRSITLLPIGGVAQLDKMPDDPHQEIRVALAGPAVNIVIAIFLWVWLSLTQGLITLEQLDITTDSFLMKLMIVNIFLAVFNLLPAFPMDGGRVLRAWLALHINHAQATRIAAGIGQAFALMMAVFGFLFNPILLFIALFVWIGAAAEAGAEQIKLVLSRIPISRAMLSEFQILSPGDTLSHAIDLTLAGSQKDFPVLENGELIGVITQLDLIDGLRRYGENSDVEKIMQRDVPTVDINEPLERVTDQLENSPCRLIGVTHHGQLVGILNLDNVMELFQFYRALHDK